MLTGYAGLPFGDFSQCTAGNVGVLGVPSEVDSGPRIGTALAPDALRKMTGQLGTVLPADGRDLGNLDLTGDWSRAMMQLVTQMVDNDIIPVVLGGASDVASAVLRALPDLQVVAAMPMARSALIERPENTIWVGLNGGQSADIWDQISRRTMTSRTARQLDEGHTGFSDMPERAVLWIDISVLDLGQAAGAVGPNPGGMKPETLVSVIGAMACRWQAIVITGLAPARDTRGISELAAIETLSAALRNE
ncbi:arginase family protein [bacterium]|nr:arginase family protein [bacterium]